ncbi:MAG: DUF2723 domain-containing protein [Ignavibacteriales bacterium]|nr:DUF2723 domain-containing protein [Ignavibacteriales bacterium]
MKEIQIKRLIGLLVFVVVAINYLITAQVSLSFWDCGEFIASSDLLQVPHPPGTPFFLLFGRLFAMLPVAENIAYRVNLVSVFSSAFTILFLYLIIIRLIENFKKDKESKTEGIFTYLAAAIGSMSLAFSDSFWFNAVEGEVYAFAIFFTAFCVWLAMVWVDKADKFGSEKYLILIGYLIGLSLGVHLYPVLTIVPIMMIVFFKKYVTDDAALKKTGYFLIVHIGILLLISLYQWSTFTESAPIGYENWKEIDKTSFIIYGLVSVVFIGIFWKKLLNKNSFYVILIAGGLLTFIIYPGIVQMIPQIIYTIGGNDFLMNLVVFLALFGILGYIIYWAKQKKYFTVALVSKFIFFVLVGYTTYTMIIIRANQDTPINLNSPKTMKEVVSYVNREQYGAASLFKRRYGQEPNLLGMYQKYNTDLEFFWDYQINHMVNRYLLWNYVGRSSTVQDDGIDFNDFYAIPLFIGLFGLFYHYRKDWKYASAYMALFLMLGYIMAIYFNMQEPQPRERDYFYVGMFFGFSVWIGIGMKGLLELAGSIVKYSKTLRSALQIAVLLFGFVGVNVLMHAKNFHWNDRSANWVPWDYAYNMLQSVDKDAVIFTNGDNDTFPLWYLQDVEGVRRDVRVANLSLLNTDWYIKQLRDNTPHGAKKIKMSFTDQVISQLQPMQWEPRTMSIEVPKEIYKQFGGKDTSVIRTGKISWLLNAPVQYGNIPAIRVQDIVAFDIIQANKWERPIYFAVTCSDDSKLGLQEYLQMEGLAFRLVPLKNETRSEYINEPILRTQLFEEPKGYSKEYQPGFKFRSLNDPNIFFDDNHVRLTANYRNSFLRLAIHYLVRNENDKALEALDMMETKLPRKIIPMDFRIKYDVSTFYFAAGGIERYKELAAELEPELLQRIEANPLDYKGKYYNPYVMLLEVYRNLNEYDKAIELLERILQYEPNDAGIISEINRLKALKGGQNPELPN